MGWGKGDPKRTRGRRWMAIRYRVLLRDRYRCQTCIRAGRHAPPDPDNEVDHRVPRHQGGTDDDANLETICADCHEAKTVRESGHVPRGTFDVSGNPDRDW